MDIQNSLIIETLKNCGREVYLVGGSVRDALLNRKTYDNDIIVTDEDARTFAQNLARTLDAVFIPLDEENKIYRLVMKDKVNYIDITNPVEGSLEKDIMRRDFTINSIVLNLRTGEIIDLTGGEEDLKNGIIRMIKPENFDDDPLRMLRAFRFESVLGFDIEPQTLEAVKSRVNLISKPAVERINCEILKLFEGKYTVKALFSMDETGLLNLIFPPIIDVKKVPPNTHHHLDLFHHSAEVVNQIQQLYETAPAAVKEHLEAHDFGGAARLGHLKLAGFLHDIGKFQTWTIEESGRHRFIKHDDVGAKMADSLLKKMHFSKKQIEYITKMIKLHIYPSSVIQAPNLSEKHYTRYIRKMENDVIDNIILAKADRLSAQGSAITPEILANNLNGLDKMLNYYLSIKDTLKPLPKLIDGKEIMEILNLKPSPKLGEIVNALKEAQISGDVNTKEEAVEFVKVYNTRQ